MRDRDRGFWCDVCGQKHYQINPACLRRRQQREYAQSDEGQRELRYRLLLVQGYSDYEARAIAYEEPEQAEILAITPPTV